jgi:hypothetical protein
MPRPGESSSIYPGRGACFPFILPTYQSYLPITKNKANLPVGGLGGPIGIGRPCSTLVFDTHSPTNPLTHELARICRAATCQLAQAYVPMRTYCHLTARKFNDTTVPTIFELFSNPRSRLAIL